MSGWRSLLGVMCVAGLNALCSVSGATAAVPTSTPMAPVAQLPPSLVTLEQKMSQLMLSSLRFSLRTTVSLPHGERKVGKLLRLLGADSRISGEATTKPAAANLSLGLFGQKLTLRSVKGALYLQIHKLARHDHGRPWVKLGPHGLAELVTVNGHSVKTGTGTTKPPQLEPQLAEPRFAALTKLLNGAGEVRELGPGMVDNQPVLRFLAILEPAQLESKALESTVQSAPTSESEAPTATLEVALSSSGLPLRTVIRVDSHRAKTTLTLNIPAANFPLEIEAPPARRTISVRRLREMEETQGKRAANRGQHPRRV
ncbi:MAG TPA: hypothetical protein VGF95_11575 [Solirubrobacteraceae bacterium]|jgi:hypothetical protein